MKKIIFVITLLGTMSVFAQDYTKYIKNVPGKDRYPNASALVVYEHVSYFFNQDTSYTKHFFKIVKVLNYKGKEKYSDFKIVYNANEDSLIWGDCFTVKNGKKIEPPKEAFHDAETYATMAYPVYFNRRQGVVNLPSVEPGDFVVLEYTLKSKPKTVFSTQELFKYQDPILHKKLEIRKPTTLYLNFLTTDKKIDFYQSGVNFVWEVENMSALKSEKNLPWFPYYKPAVFITAAKSWKEVANKFFNMLSNISYDNNAEIKKIAKLYKFSKMPDEAKLKQIYNYVHKNFMFQYFDNSNGFMPQSAETVMKNKYGSAKELTALFLAIVKEAGIFGVEPVFVSSAPIDKIKNFVLPNVFSHPAAFYHGTVLDFSEKYVEYGDPNVNMGFLLFKNGFIKPIKTDSFPALNTDVNISVLKDNMANVDFRYTYKNNEASDILWLKSETKQKKEIYFNKYFIEDNRLVFTKSPEFTGLNSFVGNVDVNFSAKIDNFLTKQKNYMYFSLPNSKSIDLVTPGNDRESPYFFNNEINVKEVYKISGLPNSLIIIKPTQEVSYSFEVDGKKLYYDLKILFQGDNMTVTRRIYIPSCIVPQDRYKAFSDFVGKITNPANSMIFLKYNPKK